MTLKSKLKGRKIQKVPGENGSSSMYSATPTPARLSTVQKPRRRRRGGSTAPARKAEMTELHQQEQRVRQQMKRERENKGLVLVYMWQDEEGGVSVL